jgi:predicted benzoate:H+ symporter BenE
MMQSRFFIPTIGAVLGILIARGQAATTLETLGAMFLGLVVGWGVYWLTSRNSRKGGV